MDKKILERMAALGLRPAGDCTATMKMTGVLIPSKKRGGGEADGVCVINKTGGVGTSTEGVIKAIAEHLDAAGGFAPRTREEMLPAEGDYIYPVFRALSKTVIEGYYTDYTQGDVLKNSTPLLERQTVYPNHDWDVNGWVGVVEQAWWDDGAEAGNGLPGINVRMKIDWLANPKLARGLLMVPPAIHSVSVSVNFSWRKSHPDLEGWKFWDMLGVEVEGRRVLIEVVEVLGYDEISLVYQGADQDAKIIDIAQPSAGIPAETNFSKEGKLDYSVAAGRAPAEPEQNTHPDLKTEDQMEETLKAILEKLGSTDPAVCLKRLEALEKCEQFIPLAIELQKSGLTPEAAAEAIQAGRSYRKKLEEDLATYAKLALLDPEQDGDKLPDGMVETLCKQDLGRLEKAVESFADRARKKYPGRSSQSPLPEEAPAGQQAANAYPPDTKRVHG